MSWSDVFDLVLSTLVTLSIFAAGVIAGRIWRIDECREQDLRRDPPDTQAGIAWHTANARLIERQTRGMLRPVEPTAKRPRIRAIGGTAHTPSQRAAEPAEPPRRA